MVGGGVAGQVPVDDLADPGVVGDLLDFGGDLVAGAAGFPAGQGGGEVVEFPADLGQGGVGEGAGLVVVQVLRVGEHDPPVLAVDVAVGVDRGQAGEPGLVDGCAAGGGQGEQVGAVAGRDGPDVVQAGRAQVLEVGGGVLSGVEHHGHRGRVRAAGAAADPGRPVGGDGPPGRVRYRWARWSIRVGNWVTSGRLPG